MPRDPAHQLLTIFGERLGAPLGDVTMRSVPWMSATFVGARHQLVFTVPPSVATEPFVAEMAEAELPLRSGFVADIAVMGCTPCERGTRMKIEVLTVEE